MKKLISILIALILIGGVAMAESNDYASMTDEELHTIIDRARNELTKRELVSGEKILLFEQDGVSVYLTGGYELKEYSGEGKHTLFLEAIVINESEYQIDVYMDTVAVNGWEVNGGVIQQVNAGKKKKDTFMISLYDADIHSYEEIEDMEFNFYVKDAINYKRLFTVDHPITVYFNK